jgi:hypothetical protein
MVHPPDHAPPVAAAEHAALIVALDAGDLTGSERRRADDLAVACRGCASLLADLALLRAATAALPAPPRTRDYRLTEADAGRLRPAGWGRLIAWLAAPRSTVRPLAGALAVLGIAGLLLGTTPGLFGQATATFSTASAPEVAPGVKASPGDGTGGSVRQGAVPLNPGAPAAGATAGPAAVSAPGATSAPGPLGALPGAAALPAPSPVAVPAPSGPPAAGVQAGPAGAGAPEPSTVATTLGAADSASKAGIQGGSPGNPTAELPPKPAPTTPDRTLQVGLSLALLLAGCGLFVANLVLRRRAA